MEKLIVDGSETWHYNSNYEYLYTSGYRSSKYLRTGDLAYCNKYKFRAINSGMANLKNNQFALQNYGGYLNIFIKDNRFSNTEDFIADLSTNNAIIVYPLATPTETDITDTTLISQLNNIADNLQTYKGGTIVFTISENLEPNIQFDYRAK